MSSPVIDVRTGGWDVRGRWSGVVAGATPRPGEVPRGQTIPWRVIAAQPDVERGQREFLPAPGTGPAKSLRDRDVDRQGAHVGGDVAGHGRILSREPAPAM
jgi:hypothetical protein